MTDESAGRESRPLPAGLIWGVDGFALFGDPARVPVAVTARGPPLIVHDVAVRLPYMLLVKGLLEASPDDTNAFALGRLEPRYRDRRFIEAAVQFYEISEADWNRAADLSIEQFTLRHYFEVQ